MGRLASIEQNLTLAANRISRGPEGDGPLDAWAESPTVSVQVTALDIAASAIHLIRRITGDLSQQGK